MKLVTKATLGLGAMLLAQNASGSSYEPEILPCISGQSCESMVSRLTTHLQLVKREGQTNILLSGISHHFRRDYTRAQLNELNEQAWGVGVERVRYTPRGHREGVSALGIRDSHSGLQLSMQYEFQYRIMHQSFVSAYLGLTAGLVARASFNYIPIPFVLPSATLRIGPVDFKSVYVPKIGAGINRGAVLFLFASIAL